MQKNFTVGALSRNSAFLMSVCLFCFSYQHFHDLLLVFPDILQKSLYSKLESYPLRGYILGSGASGTNAVDGASEAINGKKH